jgi:hypothetical protein
MELLQKSLNMREAAVFGLQFSPIHVSLWCDFFSMSIIWRLLERDDPFSFESLFAHLSFR